MSRDEEMGRFMVAVSAALESGARHVSLIDGPIDERRRKYFYAVPTEEGEFTTEKLHRSLSEGDVPVLGNWDRKSENFGLMYTIKGMKIPETLQGFQSDEARREWTSWKDKEKAMSRAVAAASRMAASGKDLGFLEAPARSAGKEARPTSKSAPGFEI